MSDMSAGAMKARVEEHRKGDLRIVALTADGKPIPNATVRLEQTSHAFRFGCNLFGWSEEESDAQALYRERFRAVHNFATLGFYWSSYEPERGKPRHAHVDKVLEWTESVGIECKGHPLVWNHSASPWYPTDLAELRRLSDERVEDCVSRFVGGIDMWDVVNEATDPFRGDNFDNLLADAWEEYGRVEFTKHCFGIARRANPAATLLINDYRLGEDYEQLIEELVDGDGKPLYDVIGLQTHQHSGATPLDRVWDTCERHSRFGVPLHFTETTFVSGPGKWEEWQETTPEGEAQQAEDAEAFYRALFSHPAVEALTWWDFSDLNAWQRAPSGLLRKDMSPKPAYDRLARLITEEWHTTTEAQSDADGVAAARGFYGDYDVTVTGTNGSRARGTVSFRRGDDATFEVRG
ncbi:1,4-beta-xylanase [Candidatus Poribacteria bacterium]|jgi:endo-1,4-beta-xylanase|nr:1,4-beta-xylanase [Candidatus Poribacteria bacterium]MBT5711590.1 1,4-beta-xylanase [Candidatus Poribacteria bacterium]MBT7806533.1 1,4-beta-xylanase [Candidatus Poribacteria bacterium]